MKNELLSLSPSLPPSLSLSTYPTINATFYWRFCIKFFDLERPITFIYVHFPNIRKDLFKVSNAESFFVLWNSEHETEETSRDIDDYYDGQHVI